MKAKAGTGRAAGEGERLSEGRHNPDLPSTLDHPSLLTR
jgi:hypothetical protein